MKTSVALLSAIVMTGIGFSSQGFGYENALQSQTIFTTIGGLDGYEDGPTLKVVGSSSEWVKLWASQQVKEPETSHGKAVEVNFKRCMVIAIFRGPRKSVRGVDANSISESDSEIRIRIGETGYQTAGKSNNEPAVRPYLFIIMSKSSKPIIIEENTQDLLGQPPVWSEWKRVSGLKAD